MVPGGDCKVDRVIETYDMVGADPRHDRLGEGLLARWRGVDGHAGAGYRTLTEWFNKRLLRRVSREHGREIDRARIDAEFAALTGEDDLKQADVLDRLEAAGIDAEELVADMVSWGTMRTHLKECLDGEKETTAGGDWERDAIATARSFARGKVESALSSLGTKGEVAGVDGASVSIRVQVACDSCPTRVPLEVALDRGYVCETHAPERIRR
jgi:hypothetical protein